MTELYIMTHKQVNDKRIPKDRTMMLVGAYNKPTIAGYLDDLGQDNISNKNANFCELTGLYAIWKYSTADIVGLEHYRRLFSDGKINLVRYKIISKNNLEKLLNEYDIILPQKHYWPNYSCLYEQYKSEHIASDIEQLENIIYNDFGEYKEAWDIVMHQRQYAYNYNMFVCRKSLIDEYCDFLFNVLFKLEPLIDLNDGRDDYHKRVFGFLSERLFNVWLVQKNNLKIKELRIATLGDKPVKDFVRRVYRWFYWKKEKK